MADPTSPYPDWLKNWMRSNDIPLWGVAGLGTFSTPRDAAGKRFPQAISFALPMTPAVMASIQAGPNAAYADEYARVNARINALSGELAAAIGERGARALPLAASVRSDPVKIKGDFPHKTAATRAGIGWVGRNCQLVTRPYGPWVRLGTVFTDLDLPAGKPVEKSLCGRCRLCVEACPAGALKGEAWYPGLARRELIDVRRCDEWKKIHYFQFHKGHNCGICSAVCPHGLKVLKPKKR